ncbi:MAG: hypothetical protein IKM02_02520 [Clostridia bacterium]|nr:hypothetical protein [Clostridia bacterium]
MKQLSLNGIWNCECIMPDGTRFSMEGAVPGCSISDLVRAGKLPGDLFWRGNADAVLSFENCDFEYARRFEIQPGEGEKCILRFERLDTYCDVFLNGILIGETMDEHIPHSFDVTDKLNAGENHLRLHFYSPVERVKGMPEHPGAFTTERLNTRRTQCTYGWDWVARFISCGISGNVSIETIPSDAVRIKHAYIYTKNADEDSAGMGIDVSFDDPLPRRLLTLRILSPDGTLCRQISRYCAEPFMRVSLDIPDAQLWYPIGYGSQPIYTLEILDGDEILHKEPFGIRTVKILQLPDCKNSPAYEKCLSIQNPHYDFNTDFSGFILKVNGVKILCKGANWVPCQPFYSGSTDSKITEALELAAECGLNMLRIWGGGTFETKHFYDECSRLGIMVTQDFLMACGQYPEDEDWFIECLRKEAEYAAVHMRNKACLMWWSGDNENAIMGCDQDENYQGRRSAFEGIAPVLYRLDPYREFLPSSPYGGNKYASNTAGTTHNTQYLGDDILPYMLSGKCDDYRQAWKKFRARFIAEEPQLGAVSYGTLKKFMTDDDIFGSSDEMWKFHTKSNPALSTHLYDISIRFAESILGAFTSSEDRFFKLRYLQYEWVRFTMEQLRREMWFQSGLIYWMYNDCWPAASGWALLDYYNKPKDAWYAFRRCAKKTVVSLDYEDGKYTLYVSNEGNAVQDARIRVMIVSEYTIQSVENILMNLPAGSTVIAGEWNISLPGNSQLVAEIHADGMTDRTFYAHGALNIRPARVNLAPVPDENAVIVSADTYVHAVELEGEAVFSDNCFSLLPGESRKIAVRGANPETITVQAYTNLF